MQAEHGQVLVVAASHLIFLLRQPSHALMTIARQSQPRGALGWCRIYAALTFQSLVAIVFVDEDIICQEKTVRNRRIRGKGAGGGIAGRKAHSSGFPAAAAGTRAAQTKSYSFGSFEGGLGEKGRWTYCGRAQDGAFEAEASGG